MVSAAPSIDVAAPVDVSNRLKSQLQQRNRDSFRQVAQTPIVENKPFTRYENLSVSASLINRALDPKNLLDWWHFDPRNNFVLEQKVTEPFLLKRGIKEVISVGVSDFTGSSPNRIKNIEATLAKFDGQIITKGETFSFNELLESVTEEAGFKYERVIVDGKDRWGLGGGICQVSTNVYRAALNAGLPINERRNHSRAIEKYAPHGLDATIYIGKQDLKFTNDTKGDILMKFVMRDQKLVTIFYGTPKDQLVKMEKVKTWKGYDGRLTTHWERKVGAESELIISHYAPTPKK